MKYDDIVLDAHGVLSRVAGGVFDEADGFAGIEEITVEARDAGAIVRARLDGAAISLRTADGVARLDDGVVRVHYDLATGAFIAAAAKPGKQGPHRLSGRVFLTLRRAL